MLMDVCAELENALRRGSKFAAVALGVLTVGWLVAASAQDPPRGVLAAAVRSSGQPCARVLEAEQTGKAASDATVYRVRCNSGLFQVTMKDGVASEVVPLE